MTEDTTAGGAHAPAARALAWIREHHWAIQPEALQTIVDIASRDHRVDLEAIARTQGRPVAGLRTVEMRGNTAVVAVTGPVFRYANLFTQISGATSLERTALEFGAVLNDPSVNAIVLAIDSPGGEVSGVHEFAQLVKSSRGQKPIIAYVSNLAASAAYWIAAAADRVVVDATAAVGSIGVVARVVTSKEKDIVEVVSSQSPSKRIDATTEDGRAKLQRHVDRIAQVFVESVADFRGVDVETVLSDFGQGGLLVGSDAVAAGMADSLGSLESTIAGASGNFMEKRHMTTQVQQPEVTREFIAANHPAIAEAFREEGRKAGREEGAVAERARIQAVEEQLVPGHEALIETLKFDGKTSGPEAAVQVLKADKEKRGDKLKALHADGATAQVAAAKAPADEGKTTKQMSVPDAISIAKRAQAYQQEQAKLGNKISTAEAVAHVTKES